MEQKYRLLFFKYLYGLLDLGKYDKELEEKKIDAITNKDIMCDEEIVCSTVSKYFYLLNEVGLDRLTEEEKGVLTSLDANNIDDKAKEFLEKTYERVLLNHSPNAETYYGPMMNPDFRAENDDIALGMKYDEFGLAQGFVREIEDVEKQDEIVADVIGRIEKSSETPRIRVIKYNELYEKLNNESPLGLW